MATLAQNLRLAVRQFKHNPAFTATVIFTLALSIGANTAVFSVTNALLLRSLPYFRPERMGTIFTRISGAFPSDERHHLNGEQWELLHEELNDPRLRLVSPDRSYEADGILIHIDGGEAWWRDE